MYILPPSIPKRIEGYRWQSFTPPQLGNPRRFRGPIYHRHTHLEAVNHFTGGLKLIRTLPQDLLRDRRELHLQLELAAALIALKSVAAEEVRVTYVRCETLSRKIGDSERLFPALRGLWNCHVLRAELDDASKMARQLVTLADGSGELSRQLTAQRIAGTTCLGLGQYRSAQDHFERGLEFYDPGEHGSYVLIYGEDPGLFCHVYRAWVMDWLGHRDSALRQLEQAVALARELPSRYALAYALALSARMFQSRGSARKSLESAEMAMSISRELGIAQWSAMSDVCVGWGLAKRGAVQEGLEQAERGVAAWSAMGAQFDLSNFLVVLAEILGWSGRAEEGLSLLDKAEEIVRRTGYRMLASELYRQRGELMLIAPGATAAEAEEQFVVAVKVAQGQEAKSLELRAAISLAHLWRDQGKTGKAYRLVAPMFNWFTEGFDTPDLKDAKALLDELA